jgi:hypothetical protein
MKPPHDASKVGKLYRKALAIQRGTARGLWMPIMWHLALRRHNGAMIDLANQLSQSNRLTDLGAPGDRFSAVGLYRRAWRMGDARAPQHLAMGCFNRNDLVGYRHWLRRAAQAGDGQAGAELRRFETRLSHSAARKIGRGRPYLKRDWTA